MQMSDNTQAIQNMQSTLIDQHKMLLEHDDKLTDEMSVLAEMVQNAINENAHVALDQTEYQKRYDDLAARYDGVKAEHDKVAGQIATLISTKTAAQQFVSTLRGLPEKVTTFNPETWGKLLDHATVYTDGSIRFTFRNGIEI